jgi:hypothetical protein
MADPDNPVKQQYFSEIKARLCHVRGIAPVRCSGFRTQDYLVLEKCYWILACCLGVLLESVASSHACVASATASHHTHM